MRPVLALVSVLALAAASLPALAEPASHQSRAQPAVMTFNDQARQFEWEIGNMRLELSRATGINETRAILARYQPVADAFADRIEQRRQEEGRLTGRYSNARTIRNAPERIAQEYDRARYTGRLNRSVRTGMGQGESAAANVPAGMPYN